MHSLDAAARAKEVKGIAARAMHRRQLRLKTLTESRFDNLLLSELDKLVISIYDII